jgi:enoyl-CoA hydratase/carnithine racemase
MKPKGFTIERDGAIAVIVFDQFVLKLELLTSLALAIYQLEEDPEVKAIILTGQRNLFLSGADLKEFDALTSSRIARKFIQIPGAMMEQLYHCRKVTFAAINGYCLGGGLELALACDFRICVDRVDNLQGEAVPFLGLPEVSLGLVSPLGSSYYLPRLLGMARAKEVMMTADSFDAEFAYRVGLVHQVTSEENLIPAAKAFAARVIRNSMPAVISAKELINRSFEKTSVAEALQAEREAFAFCCDTSEKRERIKSKRKNARDKR